MNRVAEERAYWNKAADDDHVDVKYISDVIDAHFKEYTNRLTGKVLEIGCGVGRLMKKGDCGIDISEKMIAIAKDRKPHCKFKVNDGRTIPYADREFDNVYCVLVFQHLPLDAIESYISEASRVLKKGGGFMFQFIDGLEQEPFSRHYSHSEIAKILDNAGFKIEHSTKGSGHKYWTWIEAVKI